MEQRIKILIGLSAGVLWFTSCENDAGPLIIDMGSDPVSYDQEIQPIFDIECIGCHDDTHLYLDLRSCCSYDQLLSNGTGAPYVNPDDPEQSKLYRHLTGDLTLMPPFGALPDNQLDLVIQWIEEGALNN